MASLFRGKPARPEFVVPPAESREAHAQAADVEEVKRRLTAVALMPHRQPGRADSLLDQLPTVMGACGSCGGTGRRQDKCGACNGTGSRGGHGCGTCAGRGEFDNPCVTCKGTGSIS